MHTVLFLPVVTVLERIICLLWKLIYLRSHYLQASCYVNWYCRLICSNKQDFADLCVELVTFILLLYCTCLFVARYFLITVNDIVCRTKSTTLTSVQTAWQFTAKKERKPNLVSDIQTFFLSWKSKHNASCRIMNSLNNPRADTPFSFLLTPVSSLALKDEK